MLDGYVARRWSGVTELGSQLDTLADIIFLNVVLVKMICAVYFPLWLIAWIIGIALIKCCNIAVGFRLTKHFVPVHSPLNKLCGVLLFFIPLCIGNFPWQGVMVLIIAVCVLATLAAVQEGHLIRSGAKEE